MSGYCRAEWRGKDDFRQRVSSSRGRLDTFRELRSHCRRAFPLATRAGGTGGWPTFFGGVRLAAARTSFAFESTLSGLGHAERLRALRSAGYRIEIIFLRLPSAEVALARVATRVRHGGHDVPEADIRRRFLRGWENFQNTYRVLAHVWSVYDNSSGKPILQEQSP